MQSFTNDTDTVHFVVVIQSHCGQICSHVFTFEVSRVVLLHWCGPHSVHVFSLSTAKWFVVLSWSMILGGSRFRFSGPILIARYRGGHVRAGNLRDLSPFGHVSFWLGIFQICFPTFVAVRWPQVLVWLGRLFGATCQAKLKCFRKILTVSCCEMCPHLWHGFFFLKTGQRI